ncbi:MAG: hypothetical protein F4101_02060 [Nitrospira sp. SB0673_bin_12]|nr:hypothetical protein [Nitrospira sp. SB0673_bin_12]
MPHVNKLNWFSVFKYLVYAALIANVALFFKDDWEAAAHVFQDSLPFARIIEGFAASIDTAAWVILLLLFELETCQLSDEVLARPIGLVIRGLRVLCYGVIVYAFTGYLSKALGFGLYVPAGVADAGTLVQATRLAWVDVVNSGTWLLILALLELDVRPGVKGLFASWFATARRLAKYLLYAVIAGTAMYWGLFGTFLDFWDAFLWIAAFVFIERNVWKPDEPRST